MYSTLCFSPPNTLKLFCVLLRTSTAKPDASFKEEYIPTVITFLGKSGFAQS